MPSPLNAAPARSPFMDTVTQNPLLMEPHHAGFLASSLEHMMQDERVAVEISRPTMDAQSDRDFWGDGTDEDWRTYYRPYKVIGGILQIPVMGTLLDKFSFQFGRWATGYKYIEMALKRGLSDSAVYGIALVVDSPGGMVAGCFELCAKIYDARSEKPIRAFATDSAYSAAYALACSASVLVVSTSGGVGSIGVVTMHVSYADALKQWGLEVTFVFAGKHKVDGNSYESLPDAVKARIQTRINKIYGVFTSTVAKHRDMDEEDVKATEALTYDAEEATANGLADRIGALDEELVVFSEDVAQQGDDFMAETQANTTGKKDGSDDSVSLSAHNKAVNDARAEGVAAGKAEASTAERTRIAAILGSDEAKTRSKAAMNVAMKTGMSLEDAKAFLADMPEEKAEAAPQTDATGKNQGRNHFAEAMDKGKSPDVGSGDSTDANATGEEDTTQGRVNSILSAYGGEAGVGPSKKRA
jgi:signal peptide peptidase SppA